MAPRATCPVGILDFLACRTSLPPPVHGLVSLLETTGVTVWWFVSLDYIFKFSGGRPSLAHSREVLSLC